MTISQRAFSSGFRFSKQAQGMMSAGFARIQVAHTEGGKLSIPPQFSELWIDIGTNSRDALVDRDLPPPHVFVLAFEPLLDKYATMLARHSRPLALGPNAAPLGYFHPQGIILPLAVGSSDGNATFHVSRLDGCSSLLAHQRARSGSHAGYPEHARTSCLDVLEARQVPTISLLTVLTRWLPPHVALTRLKVDAQGMDLAIVESVAAVAGALRRVDLESYPTDCEPLYVGQPMCSQIVERMQALGFQAVGGLSGRDGRVACLRAANRGGSCATQNLRFVRGLARTVSSSSDAQKLQTPLTLRTRRPSSRRPVHHHIVRRVTPAERNPHLPSQRHLQPSAHVATRPPAKSASPSLPQGGLGTARHAAHQLAGTTALPPSNGLSLDLYGCSSVSTRDGPDSPPGPDSTLSPGSLPGRADAHLCKGRAGGGVSDGVAV